MPNTYDKWDLRRITRSMYDLQDMRKVIEGRLGYTSKYKIMVNEETGEKYRDWVRKKKKVGDGTNLEAIVSDEVKGTLESLLVEISDREKELANEQKEIINDSFPFGEVLISYPGIDYKLAGVILSEVDIVEGSNVSKLWRYFGLDPTAKSKKGEKNKYNKFLKTKVVGCFGHMACLRIKHPMRAFYDARKARRIAQDWGKSKGHRHNDAVRYAVKMWIATWLYPTWRAFEGLSVRPPYQEEYLGHTHSNTVQEEATQLQA